ncbi:unnamed protein product [Clonostachys chloroleuca]|uniref:Uncharacterized protein n=1 Tax=Clonostachys chloroleuca TaxID=1926264 RepID=A0AA35M2F2_9HYPO|nr:unnamed protein product [Clonostachys chloroleuca]
MKGDPEFVILKYQAWMEAAEFEDVILGAVVKEPLSPSIGGYSITGNTEESVHLAGKYIRYKRIQQLDQFWAKLKEDADVKQTVPGWISFFNTWPVCLVVGIMVCEDVELSMDGARSRTLEGKIELPIGQITLAAGVPNPVADLSDPHVKLTSTNQTATIFKAKMGKSSIFAVELRKISTELFRRKLLQLRSDGPGVDGIRLAGDESDDEEDLEKPVAAEDLILDELSPEDYEDMVA